MAELTLEESIRQILPTLPAPIQKFFAQNKLGGIVRTLMEQYALHIDQGAVLERELLSALLGIKGPDEIAEALYTELPISKQTVLDIIADLNKEVFVPLREEMRNGPAPQAAPASPKATQGTAREGVLQQRTTIIPANPNLPRPAQTLASVPRYVPPKKYFNLQNKIPPPPNFPAPSSQPPASRLLEDHEEPHIDISEKVQVASSPVQLKPYNLPLKPVFEPPPNLPGVIQQIPIPEPPYSSDPYREPIEP